jgi:dolichol-phosphate mannosyltransferase
LEKLAGHNIPGWTAIMTAVLFLGGIQMLLQGMMGLYINSIYIEVKRRPNYIVASSIGFSRVAIESIEGRSEDRHRSDQRSAA